MSARYKFTKEPDLDNPEFDHNIRVEMSFDTNSLPELLECFGDFLRATGFQIDSIENVEPEPTWRLKEEP